MGNYQGLDFDREELSAAMRQGYANLIAFVTTPEFNAVHDEMRSLPQNERPRFVRTVLLEPTELARRGVVIPEDIMIQASSFGDRRPTLFAVKTWLPEKFHQAWENVNITFDNEYDDQKVHRNPEKAWRHPLPVALQEDLLSRGVDLETVP
jgi:hypothetical protein